jgi:hypothetical protein
VMELLFFLLVVVHELPLLLNQCAARAAACTAKILTAITLGPDLVCFTYIASSDTLHDDWHDA